jgi:predicted PurR-regulated permease PerM
VLATSGMSRTRSRAADHDQVLTNLISGSTAQIVVAIAAVLAICYAAKVPLITLLIAMLLSFVLAPIVDLLERLRIPRWAGSFLAVVLLLSCLYGAAYFSYNRAVEFMDQLPKYSQNIRNATLRFRRQAEKIQQTTQTVLPDPPNDRKTIAVKEQSTFSDWIRTSFGSISEVVLSLSFIPFLVYFMLSWSERTRNSTVHLFDPDNRRNVDVMLRGIARMMRGFLIGNFICGLFMTVVSTVFFAFLGLPYFYFLAFISGFLSLVPYLGVVLAMAPPLVAGFGQVEGTELVGIAAFVVVLHIFAINVLFPKIIGNRLRLNPLVVTMALVIWGWIWGAIGLVLAIPITGALKVIFDHTESLRRVGAWMED